MQPIRLSKQQKDALTRNFLDNLQRDQSNRAQKINDLRYYRDFFEGITQPKTDPWPGASNLFVPITRSYTYSVHPKIIQAIFGVSPTCRVVPVETDDFKSADSAEAYMEWSFKNEIRAYPAIDDTVFRALIDGVAPVYLGWRKDVRKARTLQRVQRYIGDPNQGMEKTDRQILEDALGARDGSSVQIVTIGRAGNAYDIVLLVMGAYKNARAWIDYQTETTLDVEVELEKDETFYDAPEIVPIDLDDFIVPGNATLDLHAAHHILYRREVSWDQLIRRQMRGLYTELSKKDLETMKARSEYSKTGAEPEVATFADRSLQVQEEDRRSVTGQEVARGNFEHYEYYRRWDIDGDGLEEEIIAFFDYTDQRLLGVHPLTRIISTGKRPFEAFGYAPRKASFWWIGIPELLAPVNAALNAAYNAMIDRNSVTNVPFGFYEALAGLGNESIKLVPGKLYKVANVSKIHFPQFGQRDVTSITEFNLLLAMAERLLGESDLSMGRGADRPNSPRTYGATLAILQQASMRQQQVIDRLGTGFLRGVFEQLFALYGQHLPEDKEYRVTGSKTLSRTSRNDFTFRPDFTFQANTVNINPQIARQEDMTLYTLLSRDPIVSSSPRLQVELVRMVLRTFKRQTLEDYLPGEMDIQMMKPLSAEAEEKLLLQGQDVEPHPAGNHMANIVHHLEFMARNVIDPEYLPRWQDHMRKEMMLLDVQRAAMEAGVAQQPQQQQPTRQQPNTGTPPGGPQMPPNPPPMPQQPGGNPATSGALIGAGAPAPGGYPSNQQEAIQ